MCFSEPVGPLPCTKLSKDDILDHTQEQKSYSSVVSSSTDTEPPWICRPAWWSRSSSKFTKRVTQTGLVIPLEILKVSYLWQNISGGIAHQHWAQPYLSQAFFLCPILPVCENEGSVLQGKARLKASKPGPAPDLDALPSSDEEGTFLLFFQLMLSNLQDLWPRAWS